MSRLPILLIGEERLVEMQVIGHCGGGQLRPFLDPLSAVAPARWICSSSLLIMNRRSIDQKHLNCFTGLLLSVRYPSMYGHVGKEGTIFDVEFKGSACRTKKPITAKVCFR